MPHNSTGLRCIGDKFNIFTFPKPLIPLPSLSAQTPDCVMQSVPAILWQSPATDKKRVPGFDSTLEKFV